MFHVKHFVGVEQNGLRHRPNRFSDYRVIQLFQKQDGFPYSLLKQTRGMTPVGMVKLNGYNYFFPSFCARSSGPMPWGMT